MKNLKQLIETVRLNTPSAENKRPFPAYELSGYWEKENRKERSWVCRITGLDLEENLTFAPPLDDQGKPFLYTEMQWHGEKGQGTPHGNKTWFLQEGIYRACLIARKGEPASWHLFAVVEGKREDLTKEQVCSIFQDSTPE